MDKASSDHEFRRLYVAYLERRMPETGTKAAELARRSGISPSAISRHISGSVQPRDYAKVIEALDGEEIGLENFNAYLRENGYLEDQSLNDGPSNDDERQSPTEAPTAPNQPRRGKKLTLVSISVFAVLGLMWLFLPVDLREFADGETPEFPETPNVTVVEGAQNLNPVSPNQGQAATLEELRPTIQARWYRGSISLIVEKGAGWPSGVNFQYSLDEGPYVAGISIETYLPSQTLSVRLINGDGEHDLDLTAEAISAVQAALDEASETGYSGISCHVGGCKIDRRSYCNGNWSAIAFSSGIKTARVQLSERVCEQDRSTQICVSTPFDFFASQPQDIISAQLVDKGGVSLPFSIITETPELFQNDPFLAIQELAPHPEQVDQPYAAAWFDPRFGIPKHPFNIALAAGTCFLTELSLENQFRAVYYDVDGQGKVQGDLRYFSVPRPSRDFIEITLESNDGSLYGPYQYRLSAEDLADSLLDKTDKPNSISCRIELRNKHALETWFYLCTATPHFFNVMAWSHVDSVSFGTDRDALRDTIPVEIGIQEILSYYEENHRGQGIDVFEYEPSRDQNFIFFEINYKDGTSSVVQRLPLPNPP